MTPRTLALVTSLATTLLAGAALACSAPDMMMMPTVVPAAGMGVELPLGARLFVHPGGEVALDDIVDPAGAAIEWELEDTDFGNGMRLAWPVDGWQPGAYRFSWDEEGVSDPAYTVLDEVDEEAPQVEILSWEGWSQRADLPTFCGGGGIDPAGVRVELSQIDEPVALVYDLVGDHKDADRRQTHLGGTSHFIATNQGAEVDIHVEAIDLSGNSTTASSLDAMACTGCSGSMSAGSSGSAFALIGFLLLAARRRTATVEA